ncbi:NAD(P)/FAD-dependent oxidoreductase [Flavilitoribacter nigricans]|uniref:FAD dependent oxidoreductase domain-containing protein n=1 Tax=Flavilitoribacter nigricans (strain ATCC 23147 / DSM 23189 / NBRC 102662 / NCIMB 1420 / SS-2) TaxID=1122177 RepID=A0A2D0NBW2_FLAN2|nr:FAD-dependent oxidoreductase [Flavilitoribacter nigricans]PHN05669.1 hypothetical protein CRP01_14395 [Flavilitoribacter nigricans DSM 23189 = NBRC 102662]
MNPQAIQYDFAVIGGGLFGCYAALYLAGKGQRVLLIEKEAELLRKASIVNQARLHAGYHYPRSVATAVMSDDNRLRFAAEHRPFINGHFDKYYAIDRHGSFTDSVQFERFCEHIGLPYQRIAAQPLFNFDRIEALYLTREETFDPILIAQYYRQKLRAEKRIELYRQTTVIRAEPAADHWKLQLRTGGEDHGAMISAGQVINATYAASNAVNRVFGLESIDLMHEISEMAFVTSPQLKNLGLTVMDGPFASLMPYGLSGLLSLSSVAYTHHKVSYAAMPTFDCQELRMDCRPDFVANCTDCAYRPASNYRKMISQIRQYFQEDVDFHYFRSFYTVKSKLKANYIDDGRPTEIAVMRENPRFYCIFAGKINSIYEIEKIVEVA